jgi:hypothetical protein
MIEAIAALKPARWSVISQSDRGFVGAAFRADVRVAKLHDVIGVRGNLQASGDGKKDTMRKLACLRGDGTIRRDGVALTAKQNAVGAFVSSWDEKSNGLCLELVSEPDRAVRRNASLARTVFEDGLEARRERSTPQGDADLRHGDGRL